MLVLVIIERKPCLFAHDPCDQETCLDFFMRVFVKRLHVIVFRYGILVRLDKGIERFRYCVEVESEADHRGRIFPCVLSEERTWISLSSAVQPVFDPVNVMRILVVLAGYSQCLELSCVHHCLRDEEPASDRFVIEDHEPCRAFIVLILECDRAGHEELRSVVVAFRLGSDLKGDVLRAVQHGVFLKEVPDAVVRVYALRHFL